MNWLKCVLFGCPAWPKRPVILQDDEMPKGARLAMACSRCGSVDSLSVENRRRMIDLQRSEH